LPIPFFEKAKFRNLEVSRPYKTTRPKIQYSHAAYPNSKFLAKGISKNGNGDGTIGSKSKPTGIFQFIL